MPRKARNYSEMKVYHIIIRGVDKQKIFYEDKDKSKFLKIIKSTQEKYTFEIYAYCLMDNHVHMVIYDKENQLSKIMQSIEISYVIYFNSKYERVGHLFQNRFLSKKIENQNYLMQVCRYIHQNPLKAGICKTEEYKWSSYNEYVKKNKIINPQMMFGLFSENYDEAKDSFIKFHNLNLNLDKKTEFKNMLDYEIYDRLNDIEATKYICDFWKINDVHEILDYNREIRDKFLADLGEIKLISMRQMSRILGINRKIIERAIKKNILTT